MVVSARKEGKNLTIPIDKDAQNISTANPQAILAVATGSIGTLKVDYRNGESIYFNQKHEGKIINASDAIDTNDSSMVYIITRVGTENIDGKKYTYIQS